MRTDELIDALALGLRPVRRGEAAARLALMAAAGDLVSAALLLAILGARPDLWQAMAVPGFWLKWSFSLGLAAAAGATALRLGRPGATLGGLGWLPALPPLAVLALAAVELAATPMALRQAALFGETWANCLASVALLSLPVLLGALAALRRLAPTRPRLAGLHAGLLAGGVGAAVYALHCPESSAAFLATWYGLGILAAGGAGAVAGPLLLKW